LPVKTILQVIGRNLGEWETPLLHQVDLILSAETMGYEIVGRIRSVLEPPL